MSQDREHLREQLCELLTTNRAEQIPDLLNGVHSADVAHILETLDPEQRGRVLVTLPPPTAGEVLFELSEASLTQVLEALPENFLIAIIEDLDSDDAADIVSLLPAERAGIILRRMDKVDSAEVQALLKYPEDTAGGIMQVEMIRVHTRDRVRDAIETIRARREEVENLNNVFVVNDANRVVGILPLSKLILLAPDSLISEVMEPNPTLIYVDEDQEEVAKKFQRYDMFSAPVVDRDGKLLGRITADDVFDVVLDEVSEDFLKLAGTGSEDIVYGTQVFRISRIRLPWLITNLFGSIITGYCLWLFKLTIRDTIALVTFIPAITAMGGNVGIQTSMIMVRGFAIGRVSFWDLKRILFKEIRVAVIMGLCCGFTLAAVAYLWHGEPILGLVVGVAMVTVIVLAGAMGTLMPALFKKLSVDPALASGPFVTTVNDITGILIYLGVAAALLSLFG